MLTSWLKKNHERPFGVGHKKEIRHVDFVPNITYVRRLSTKFHQNSYVLSSQQMTTNQNKRKVYCYPYFYLFEAICNMRDIAGAKES